MSPGYIRQEAAKAARHARRNGYRPITVTAEMKAALLRTLESGERPPFQIPWTGGYAPRGYVPTGEPLFVDTSGFGSDREPALSQPQFFQRLRPGYAYALVEAGQFQGYVQEYVPPKSTLSDQRYDALKALEEVDRANARADEIMQ